MRNLTIIICLFFISQSALTQNTSIFFEKADSFFGQYVVNGKVAYGEISREPKKLDEIMAVAKGISVAGEDADVFRAFWINAYNLAVIKGIIDNYPIESPLDKEGFFDKITYNLGGSTITLNDIENKMLRARFKDARIHFVLVCGAKGCPPIISEAYKPESIDEQLQIQTRLALNNPDFIRTEDHNVVISEIFKWYKEDFIKDGNEIDFINKYRKNKIPTDYKVKYYPYDWSLNMQ